MNTETKNYLKTLSIAVAIILLGVIVGRIFFTFMKNWAWIPIVLFYWTAISIVIYLDKNKISEYFKGFKFKTLPFILIIIIGLIPLPIFLKYIQLLNPFYLVILWLLVAFINPFFEEIFWRGFMLNKNETIPFWIKATIASFLFAIAHPLTWGMFSQNMLSVEMFISVFLMGIVWSFAYKKTNSLILPYISHFMVDLFNLSVLAFLNLLPVMDKLYN